MAPPLFSSLLHSFLSPPFPLYSTVSSPSHSAPPPLTFFLFRFSSLVFFSNNSTFFLLTFISPHFKNIFVYFTLLQTFLPFHHRGLSYFSFSPQFPPISFPPLCSPYPPLCLFFPAESADPTVVMMMMSLPS